MTSTSEGLISNFHTTKHFLCCLNHTSWAIQTATKNIRSIQCEAILFTGGWRKSWSFLAGFVPRLLWVGDFSGSPWPCLWWCAWLSVFSHSSVTATTDVRTRKQRRDYDGMKKTCSSTTKEPKKQNGSCPLCLSADHISTKRTHLNP